MPSAVPVPRDFLCEHTPAKSRVFAVLTSPGGPDTLKAVLTCTDPVLAQRAASALAVLAQSGGGGAIDADAEEIATALPAAPAASFREACRRLRDREWPLIPAQGAELADWQRESITGEFGGGWRLRNEESGDSESVHPDFAALFPVRSCDLDHANEDEEDACEICGSWQLTPRTADMLHTALENLSDEAHDDADEKGDEPVPGKNADDWSFFDRLPRITWGMDAEWRRQFGRACDDLVQDLAVGEWPRPRCTAEEMALHLAIEDAPGYLEMWQEAKDERHEALPKHRDDYDWGMCSEILFEDHDVLMLYDASLDGFEDPGGDLNQENGVGDLRPAVWFKFFAHLEPRDPDRDFRR